MIESAMTMQTPSPAATAPITAEYVAGRLAVAAAALPVLLSTPAGIEYARPHAETIRPFYEAYGRMPPARKQSLSDPYKQSVIVVFSWLNYIEESAPFLRRAVALRAVPTPGGQPRTWADLGRSLRTNQRRVKRLHDNGIAMIVDALNAPNQ
jgi:hypothetical protein